MLQYVTAGANPMSVKKGIDKTCDFLIGKLKEHAKPVKGRLDIKVSGGRRGGRSGNNLWSFIEQPAKPVKGGTWNNKVEHL